MVQSLGVSEHILIKLNISSSFGNLKEVNPRWPLTDLDKERLNFAASVNLYGTLVFFFREFTGPLFTWRTLYKYILKCIQSKSVFTNGMKTI